MVFTPVPSGKVHLRFFRRDLLVEESKKIRYSHDFEAQLYIIAKRLDSNT